MPARRPWRRDESERLLALHQASVVLAAQTNPDQVLEKVLETAGQLLGADSGTFYRWDPEARLLRCVHNWRVPAVDTTPDQQPGEGLAGHAFLRMAPLIVNDYPGWEQAMASGLQAGLCAGLAVPLTRGDRPLGVLLMRSYDDVVRFTEEDARLLGLFGDQAAIAIENAELHGAALRRGEELAALLRAGRTIMSGLDLQATLERIVREAAQSVGWSAPAPSSAARCPPTRRRRSR